jgi:hypothetical protein
MATEFRLSLEHQGGDATCAVAALFDLAAVGIEDAIEDTMRPVARCREHQRLVESDSRMPVAERTKRVRIEVIIRGSRGIEYQEIVAETLHLQKLDAHQRSISLRGHRIISGGGGCASRTRVLPY